MAQAWDAIYKTLYIRVQLDFVNCLKIKEIKMTYFIVVVFLCVLGVSGGGSSDFLVLTEIPSNGSPKCEQSSKDISLPVQRNPSSQIEPRPLPKAVRHRLLFLEVFCTEEFILACTHVTHAVKLLFIRQQ